MITLQAGPFKTAHDDGNRSYACRAVFDFGDETTLDVYDSKIWDGSFKFDTAVSGESSFEIGACISNQFSLILNNISGDFTEYTFVGAEVTAYIGLYDVDGELIPQTDGGTDYWIQKGVYFVDTVNTNGDLIKLTCLDGMINLDVPYPLPSFSGRTMWSVFQNVYNTGGISPAISQTDFYQLFADVTGLEAWVMSTYPVSATAEELAALNCRDILSLICQTVGAYAFIDRFGRLDLKRFDTDFLKSVSVDADDFDNCHAYAPSDLMSFQREENDVTITGVIITDSYGDTAYSAGTDAYPFKIENTFITRAMLPGRTVNGLFGIYGGVKFRPFSMRHLPDLTLEPGDNVLIADRKGAVYRSTVTHTIYAAASMQNTECNAEPGALASSTRYSTSARAVAQSAITTYPDLLDKPAINSVTLVGNLTGDDLALVDESDKLATEDIDELMRLSDAADNA